MVHFKKNTGRIWQRYWNSPTLTTYSSFIAKSLNLVVVLPLVIQRLSSSEAAVWLLISTVFSFRILLDFGFTSTFARLFAYAMGGLKYLIEGKINVIQKEPVSGPNWKTVGLIWETMQVIYSGLAGISILLLITAGSWSMQKPISELTDPSQGWFAWICVSFGFPIALWGFRYNSFLMGTNHISLFRRYETIVNLISCIALIIILIWTPNLVSMTIVFYSVQVFGVWINHRLSLSINNGIISSFSNWRIDRKVIAIVWPIAWRSFLGVLFSAGLWNLTGFIYAQYAKAADLSIYLFSLQFLTGIGQFCQSPFYSRIPIMAKLRFQGKTREIVRIAQRGMCYTYISYVLLASIVGWMFWATKLSIGNDFFPCVDLSLWFLLGLTILAERYGAMHLQLFSTTNIIVWHIANGITGLIIIFCLLILPSLLGVIGFPLSFLVGYVCFYCWYTARLSYRSIGYSFWQYEKTTMVVFCALFFICNLLASILI